MIEITTSGIKELNADLKQLPDKLERRVILNLSQIAFDGVQRGAGRHSKTGALFQSVYNRSIPGGRSVGHDTSRAPYAQFVVFGTRPHVIRPKNKKALRWVGPGGGFSFAKKVNHPGYRGDDYFGQVKDNVLRIFSNIVNDEFKGLL